MNSQIHLYLGVHAPDAGVGVTAGKYRTYRKWMTSSFGPQAGDRIMLGDGDDAPSATVKSAWWLANGDLGIALVPFQVDPNPEAEHLVDGTYRDRWDSATMGHLHATLVGYGWSLDT